MGQTLRKYYGQKFACATFTVLTNHKNRRIIFPYMPFLWCPTIIPRPKKISFDMLAAETPI